MGKAVLSIEDSELLQDIRAGFERVGFSFWKTVLASLPANASEREF
jgi:hypothetical protein